MSVTWHAVALSSLILCGAAQAETILKCVDAAGNVTFTQTRCPAGLKLESSSEVENVPPGGGNEVIKLAEPAKPSPQPAEPVAPPAPANNAPPASSVGERPGPPAFVPGQSYDYQQNGYGGYPFPWPPYANGWNQHPGHGNGSQPTPRPLLPGQGPGQNRPPAPRPSNSPTPGQPAHGVPTPYLQP